MHRFDPFIEAISERNEKAPLVPPPLPVVMPNVEDGPEEIETHLRGAAEGQSFMIEYCDAELQRSLRRITVSGIWSNTPGIWVMVARCHERNAMRSFRSDRILQCIDYDGTAHPDGVVFLADTFSLPDADTESSGTSRNLRLLKPIIRPHIVLLCALGLGSGSLATEQSRIIVDHSQAISRHSRFKLTSRDVKNLTAYIQRQRPGKRVLYEACYEMRSIRDKKILNEFMSSALRLVISDEIKHPEERWLFELLSNELAGTGNS